MSAHQAVRPPIFLLAFDHRVVLTNILSKEGIKPEFGVLALAKTVVLEALDAALAEEPRIGGASGILIDEQYGSHAALLARARGHQVAMPVEMSETFPMTLQFGDDMATHIEAFDPDYVKTLVRYNVESDAETNEQQARDLRRLTTWCRDAGRRFMVEVLTPPTDGQRDRAAGDLRRFQEQMLPDLISKAVLSLRERGVSPDVWKLEGVNTVEQAAMVSESCVSGADRDVRCIVLGRGESADQVAVWIDAAARSGGFDGFAIGRTIWSEAVVGLLKGTLSREAAVRMMSARFLSYVLPFLGGTASDGRDGGRPVGDR